MVVRYSPSGSAFSNIILEIFRLNGRLLAEGDRMMAPLGLTSARWQVLGAIGTAGKDDTVSGLARNMGLTRQGVQRIVSELAKDGIVELIGNPNHRRAKLVVMTAHGNNLYTSTFDIQSPWVNAVAATIEADSINAAAATLHALRLQIERESKAVDE